jgi:golgi-specific brefeldin A-resistance guanine nucleotide exchange factor 1
MLNTDQHKAKDIPEKMTLEQFKRQCKKINDGDDLPEEFLKECYTDIVGQEMKVFKYRDMSSEENITRGIIFLEP